MSTPVNSLLALLVNHGADELRLATDEAPRMYARGVQKRLALPVTPGDMLRHLLGSLLSSAQEELLRRGADAEFDYEPNAGGERFHVVLKARGALPTPAGDVFPLEASFRAIGRGAAPVRPAAAPARAEQAASELVPSALSGPGERPESVPGEADPIAATAARAALVDGELASLLAEAQRLRASDLHLVDGSLPFVRIDGVLRPLSESPIGSVAALLRGLPDAVVRDAVTGRRALDDTIEFEDRRFRLHVYRTAEGGAAAIRILPLAAPSLAELRLPVSIADLALLPNGLVVVCGPSGSGKSATLAALAQEAMRRRSPLLLTLEDPIEYRIQAGAGGAMGIVRQRQIGRDVADFPSGLRDALREDPDIILVGEMRDAESVALALTAAETGHLVLASLHSRSAASAIERIVDASPSRRESEVRAQLAQALRAVVAQRLLPRERGGGRVAAVEVLRVNHNVGGLIREGKTAQIATALQSSRKEGMVPLEVTLAELVRAGTVSLEHALAVANDPSTLTAQLAART